MIVLFTDFGVGGPYLGQLKRVLHQRAPGVPVVDLFVDAPRFDPRASAYLLATYREGFPAGSVFVGVVDPGVGTGARPPVVVRAGSHWFVGPGNGLFDIVARRSGDAQAWLIGWVPTALSSSFHGRDLFAPVAAAICRGDRSVLGAALPEPVFAHAWPDELPEVIYLDHYGNAMTGLLGSSLTDTAVLQVEGRLARYARTFGLASAGELFWYRNSNGLVELAAKQCAVTAIVDVRIGTPIGIVR